MRIIKKSFERCTENFKEISSFADETHLASEIENGLSTIFLISQNLPIKQPSDFFSGQDFSLAESFEELECSYHLVKFGFYKQAFISLRVALDIGLFSIYWSILGTENVDFKKWLSSKKDTPFKNKSFWDVLQSNNSIHTFDHKYDLIGEIKNLGFSDFVHTKGLMYSNFGEFQRKIRGKDKFENFRHWTHNFKEVVRTLSILHLLKFPSLTLRYSTDYLLARFGTFDRIPIFGGGHGDEMKNISAFIESGQLKMINELASKDPEVIEIKN